jgi:hypothetical protein
MALGQIVEGYGKTCGHKHKTEEAAKQCAKQKKEKKLPQWQSFRIWKVETT